ISMIASSRERRRSLCPVSRRSFGRIVPSRCHEGITTRDSAESSKMKLQAFGASSPKSLQSQMPSRPENRLLLNGLGDFSRPTNSRSELRMKTWMARDIGERSDAVLRTAMPGHDAAAELPSLRYLAERLADGQH